ncbi:MAG: hypothetical protein M1835_002427 [Candelina submexicana]|nr:MAG: hypothetical protein M1835_002427 [Candelina submexicana]
MDTKKDEARVTEETEPTTTEGSSATKSKLKNQTSADVAVKKGHKKCKAKPAKGAKKKKKARKDSSEDSTDASSSSSSDESLSEDEDEVSSESDSSSTSSDEETDKQKRKRKARKALLKKQKARRKAKSRKRQDSSSDSSSSSSSEAMSDEYSSEDEKARKKAKSRKKKAKKGRKASSEDSKDEDAEETENAALRAQIARLGLGGGPRVINRVSRAGLRMRKGLPNDVDEITNKKSSKKSSKKAKDKKKRVGKAEFKRVDQLWDSSIHNYKLTETVEDEEADNDDDFVFLVRRKFDWEGKYTDTVVDVKSPHLKAALLDVMDGVKGISLVEETPVIDPNMLFLYLEELRQYAKDLRSKRKAEKKRKAKKNMGRKISHIKALVKYLDVDYAEIKNTLYPLLENNLITFDLLWALFKPNTIAYTTTYGNVDEPRAFKIECATKESSFMKGQWYCVEGRYLEYDGKSFGMGQMEMDVPSFQGARKITGLACYPLKYYKDQEALKPKLIERGKKFIALKGMNYRFHKGMAFYKKKKSVIKVNIDGRVMVDPQIHRRINPNYPISTVKPEDPDGGCSDDDDDEEDSDSCGCCGDSDDDGQKNGVGGGLGDEDVKEKTRTKIMIDGSGKARVVRVRLDADGDEVQEENIDALGDEEDKPEREFTDEELMIASPVVLGFAFSEKHWLEFTVSGIKDIDWNEGAFDSLVLPDNQKSIVKALVESHKFHASQSIDDVIQGKGKGLVAVLHGPPGTGKTLTAEGIAELLKCPLYMVSAGELGTDPRTLEAELNKILDIAHSWGAVLLLDEADVFLEKRTIHDIHRNALVSIFLRLLEYFQGILFLTTNRVETFDDAFQSRIHLALRYGELTTKAKRAVWKLFLERVRAMEGVETAPFKDSDYDSLARNNLNGRQIKNAVRTAQALAVNQKEKLSMEHIKRVLDVAESFEHDLKGGTGYLDAMRSYT